MDASSDSQPAPPPASADDMLGTILGYLNFSSGRPDVGVQRAFNQWWSGLEAIGAWSNLRDRLLEGLADRRGTSPAFSDCRQAEAVVTLAFDECLPAYRAHHADLLAHLADEDFQHPFFAVRVCEAVLSQGGPWDERDRIASGALDQLNDFLGYRPLPVLENGRQMQPYPHERFRPIPLYIRGAGVGAGKYRALLERTIRFFQETPEDILRESHFDLARMDELALDVRAHDHSHPMNKRTNYMFGEWDPHLIDNKGYYRRFVVRQIILDLLLEWMHDCDDVPQEELLFDASAALCGTMLMASAVSGAGPDTHDSEVTLTSLLPRIARQRDTFYERLLQDVRGDRARRLRREAKLTQQPFGHVRQQLNMRLASYGARQVQYQHLAQLFARMGFAEESRRQAERIPAPSIRFECEMNWRITAAHFDVDRGRLEDVRRHIEEVEELLERGIQCGAIVDPWNILGFQDLFPLFHSREDSIVDLRVEQLLGLMERIFSLYSRALGEAAARGDEPLCHTLTERFRQLAEHWDRYGSTTVASLPYVSGEESFQSAQQVSGALAEWRKAGEAAGDISFWRERVDQFQSAKAYALIVEALLQKGDHVAARGLLMHWLSQADEVGLESGEHSLFSLLVRWMQMVGQPDVERGSADDVWPAIRRLFDYLEANAGDYGTVPRLSSATGATAAPSEENAPLEWPEEPDDEEDNLYEAAYDNVVYRDSADDGLVGDTIDDAPASGDTEFALINRFFEPRLKFLNTLAQLWQMAAAALLAPANQEGRGKRALPKIDAERTDVIVSWADHVERLQRDLDTQIIAVWRHELPWYGDQWGGDGEYGVGLQEKFDLLHAMIATSISCRNASRCLLACVPDSACRDISLPADERLMVQLFRAMFRRDAAEARRLLPRLRRQLSRRPLLYVPLENGGHPDKVQATRYLLSNLRFLLSQLPQAGLLKEAWGLLQTAFRMERASRPGGGTAVTEFDRLFRTALHSSLQAVIGHRRAPTDVRCAPDSTSVRGTFSREASAFTDEEMIEFVGEIVERYLDLWLKHSATTRLSSVEKLEEESTWRDVKDFIAEYGADLFNARMLLPPGKIRAILHHGVERFLDELVEQQDPLTPLRLVEDLDSGAVDRDYVVDCLELIYEALMDGLERFLEYKTTTTQSDYGEMFYCLLDFLRLEAAYERDAWNLAPVGIAHELLAGPEKSEAAMIWEKLFAEKTGNKAERHLSHLEALEKRHGMRLPSVSDRLNERFIKPLAVNRMLALVGPAMQDARQGRIPSRSFELLRDEIEEYVHSTNGSGLDVPDWMHSLARAVEKEDCYTAAASYQSETEFHLPRVPLSPRQIRQQLRSWNETGSKKKSSPSRKRGGKKKPGGKGKHPKGSSPD